MLSKKRVLVFIDWFLPGDKAGGPVRSVANLIAHLGDEFEFSVITRDTDYTSTQPYSNVKSNAWNETLPGVRVCYISADQLTKETIQRLLNETEYDHVYLNGMWSQPFTRWPLEILAKQKPNVPVTLAVRGMLAPSAMAIKSFKKRAFLTLAKWRKLYSRVTFHATNETEAREVHDTFSEAKVKIAGNLPRKSDQRIFEHPAKEEGRLRIVNIARIAPEKNTLFAIEVLKNVKSNVEFDIWGARYDEAYAQQCEAAVKKLPANIKVTFRGPLENTHVYETLAASDLMFLPTQGENFGHVILEAMEAGTPVLISDKTPWKDLSQRKAGWMLPLDSPNTFATRIDAVAQMNPTDFSEWRTGATQFARNYSNNPKLITANQKLFL